MTKIEPLTKEERANMSRNAMALLHRGHDASPRVGVREQDVASCLLRALETLDAVEAERDALAAKLAETRTAEDERVDAMAWLGVEATKATEKSDRYYAEQASVSGQVYASISTAYCMAQRSLQEGAHVGAAAKGGVKA